MQGNLLLISHPELTLSKPNPIYDFDAPPIKGHTNIMEFDWCLLRFQFLGKRDSLKLVNNYNTKESERKLSAVFVQQHIFSKKIKTLSLCTHHKPLVRVGSRYTDQNFRFSSLYV